MRSRRQLRGLRPAVALAAERRAGEVFQPRTALPGHEEPRGGRSLLGFFPLCLPGLFLFFKLGRGLGQRCFGFLCPLGERIELGLIGLDVFLHGGEAGFGFF